MITVKNNNVGTSAPKVNGEKGKGFVIRSSTSSNSEAVRSNQMRAQRESAASDGVVRHRQAKERKRKGKPGYPKLMGQRKSPCSNPG
jgi:hypothetical protein